MVTKHVRARDDDEHDRRKRRGVDGRSYRKNVRHHRRRESDDSSSESSSSDDGHGPVRFIRRKRERSISPEPEPYVYFLRDGKGRRRNEDSKHSRRWKRLQEHQRMLEEKKEKARPIVRYVVVHDDLY